MRTTRAGANIRGWTTTIYKTRRDLPGSYITTFFYYSQLLFMRSFQRTRYVQRRSYRVFLMMPSFSGYFWAYESPLRLKPANKVKTEVTSPHYAKGSVRPMLPYVTTLCLKSFPSLLIPGTTSLPKDIVAYLDFRCLYFFRVQKSIELDTFIPARENILELVLWIWISVVIFNGRKAYAIIEHDVFLLKV